MPISPIREEDKKLVKAFMAANPLGVIASVGFGKAQPESALVAFAESDELEIIFQTRNDSRKYQNIILNPEVAFTIGWDPLEHRTLQYEGLAQEVYGVEHERLKTVFLAKKTPSKPEYLEDPHSRLFLVRPKWVRFADYTGTAPKVVELDFAQHVQPKTGK